MLQQQYSKILPRKLTWLYVEMQHTENPQPLLDTHLTGSQLIPILDHFQIDNSYE